MVLSSKKRLSFLFCFAFLFFQNTANAQWEQLNGPLGIGINCLNYKDSILFAGSSGFYMSIDSGRHWTIKSNGLSGPYSNPCIVNVIESTSNGILVGTDKDGIFRTTDDGDSWTAVNNGFPQDTTFPYLFPRINDMFKSDSIIVAATSFKIYYSLDDGLTWQNANGLPPNCYSLHFAKKDSVLYASNYNGGILKSTDNGINWTSLSSVPDTNVGFIAVNSSSIIITTDTSTLYKSIDNGNSWQILNTGVVTSMIYSLNVFGNDIYVGTINGLHYSPDNGLTWSTISDKVCPTGFKNTILNFNSNLFSTSNFGIFISDDNGVTWEMTNDGLPSSIVDKVIPFGNKLYCLSGNRLMLSPDSGYSWSYISRNINTYYFDIAVLDNTLIALAYYSGIFFSSDYGNSWHLKNNGLSCSRVIAIAVSQHAIFITTDSCGVYKSLDMGENWTSINNGLPLNNYYLIAANDSVIFITRQAPYGYDIYQSYDEGASWTLFAYEVLVSDIDISNNGIIIVDFLNGISISKDNGHTWNLVNSGIPEAIDMPPGYFGCIIGATNGTEFLFSTQLQGLYMLKDSTWVPVNNGFPTYAAIMNGNFYPNLYFDNNDLIIEDSIIYAGFNPGLWKRRISDIKINKHSGNIFADLNNNYYKDSTDYGIPYVIVETTNDCSYYTSNSSGNYNAYTEYLQDTLLAIQPSPYATVYPQYYAVTESDTGNNFAVHFIPDVKDLRVTVTNFFDANPGFDDMIRITYKNMGTDTMSGTVKLFFNDSIDFASSNPAYTTLSGDSLAWNFTNLLPFESRNINIIFYIPTDFFYNPDTLFLSDSILFSAFIYPVIGDTFPSDNSDSIYQFISSAYDPNSTEVFPPGCITPTYIASGEKLVYTIRFQNTGTDTAHFVTIIDSLDQNLDIPTFEMLSASHPYTYSIKGKGIVEFNFPDIFLPDSNANELLSHGFVKFSIKPKSNVMPGNIIQNKANIYFDFNPPVVTNTTSNPIQSECGVTGPNYNGQSILIFPNPSINNITIAYSSNEKPIIEIFDVDGRCLFKKQTTNEHFINIDVSKYSQGVYFVKAIFEDSVESGKFIVQ